MFRGRRSALFLLFLLVSTSLALADGVIHNLQYQLRDEILSVSFRLRGAVDDETSKVIQSGAPSSFQYNIDLIERRSYWLDRSVTHVAITTSAVYDTLTRRYALTLERGDEPVANSSTTGYDEAERWLTSVNQARVISRTQLKAATHYSLRVRAHLGTRLYFYFFPWEETTPWETIDFSTP